MKDKEFPKKAKLITDGGFYKIVNLPERTMKYIYPLKKRITLMTPETNITDITVSFNCEFVFNRVYKGYAEFRQYNVTSTVK